MSYELLNYVEKTEINNIDDIIDLLKKTLKKYQYKTGGFDLEDYEWFYANETSNRFAVKPNQRILYNSIDICKNRIASNELVTFMDNILNYIKRSINNNDYDIMNCSYTDKKHSVIWILFIIVKK